LHLIVVAICDHLLFHAENVKVAHPLILQAIAAVKRKNDRIDADRIAGRPRCDFLPKCHTARIGSRTGGGRCGIASTKSGRWRS
jgi:hypothetical protein